MGGTWGAGGRPCPEVSPRDLGKPTFYMGRLMSATFTDHTDRFSRVPLGSSPVVLNGDPHCGSRGPTLTALPRDAVAQPGLQVARAPWEGCLSSGWLGVADAHPPPAGARQPCGRGARAVHLRPGQQAHAPGGPRTAAAGEVPAAPQPPLLPAVPPELRPPRALGRLLPEPGTSGNLQVGPHGALNPRSASKKGTRLGLGGATKWLRLRY